MSDTDPDPAIESEADDETVPPGGAAPQAGPEAEIAPADAAGGPPPKAYSYGTRDVQPGYETSTDPTVSAPDFTKSERYDTPRDPREPGNWGAPDA